MEQICQEAICVTSSSDLIIGHEEQRRFLILRMSLICKMWEFLHVIHSGITSLYQNYSRHQYVRFGRGLFIEATVSIYSSKWLHQETAQNVYHHANIHCICW